MPCNYTETVVRYKLLDFMGGEGYRVGDDGSVWTRWRLRGRKGHHGGTESYQSGIWKRLKPIKSGNYRSVAFRGNGKGEIYRVHRLVLFAFVGPCPTGMQCRHLDGNPENNRLDNLCWGTPKENSADKVRHGRPQMGDNNPNHVNTSRDAANIRRLRRIGWSAGRLALEFGISKSTVEQIIYGRTWKHVV